MRLWVLLSLLAFHVTAADRARPVVHVRNFGIVNAHLMRGAEPTATGLAELDSAGVRLVIDLRETGAATGFERQSAEKLGMKYVNVPLPPFAAPSPGVIEKVLSLLTENQSDVIFIHCRRGKDRTGTVVACYRIQHDGWNNDRAFREAKQYGMSFAEHGMREFILHYTPLTSVISVKP